MLITDHTHSHSGVEDRFIERLEAIGGDRKYAYLVDDPCAERFTSLTSKRKYVETPAFRCTLIDVPGHNTYVRNAVDGLQQADKAVLVIDASKVSALEYVFLLTPPPPLEGTVRGWAYGVPVGTTPLDMSRQQPSQCFDCSAANSPVEGGRQSSTSHSHSHLE